MRYRPDPGTLAGLLVILVVAIAMFLLVMGMRAHAAGPPEKWGHGYAILWWAPLVSEPYCFLPGTRV